MSRVWKAIRSFTMRCLDPTLLSRRLHNRKLRKPSSLAFNTRMRPTFGRLDFGVRELPWLALIPARYIECMEWFLAPYPIGGGQGDPLKAPDITNNSWGCPPSEGCSPDTLQAAIEAQAAAGIMTVVRADSSGPACSTMENPPSIY